MLRDSAARLSLLEAAPRVLFVGAGRPGRARWVERAARRADVAVQEVEGFEAARATLRAATTSPPRALILDGGSQVAHFVEWLRGQGHLFSVPVLLMVPRPTEAAYAEAHALGADDVVLSSDLGGLTRRLARLAELDPARRPSPTAGRALLAHPDEGRRRVLGRVLRMAGFDVAFAASEEEAEQVALRHTPPSVLVVSDDFGAHGGWPLVQRLRSVLGAPELPAVLLCHGRERLDRCRDLSARHPALGAVFGRGPADDLLFVANELLRPGVRELRASDRLLHGSLCAFRPAGVFEHGYGLTYNISREGMFIRTLDPPPPGNGLWVELRPPGRAEAVHLRAELMWSKTLGGGGGAAPPGFGLRFDASASPSEDLRIYREAYETLREQVHGRDTGSPSSGPSDNGP